MSPSIPPPSAPLFQRAGTALAGAAFGAVLAAVPPALRIAQGSDVSVVYAVPLVAGLVAIPVVVLGLVGRRAHGGWVALGPDEGGLRISVAIGWLAWLAFVALRFGAVLRAKTHHHALASVTFALGVMVAAAFLALVARRGLTLLQSLAQRAETLPRLLAIGWVVLPLLGILLALRSAAPDLEMDARAGIIDGAALFVGAMVAARPIMPSRVTAGIGALAFLVLLAAAASGLVHASVLAEVREGAPLLGRCLPH